MSTTEQGLRNRIAALEAENTALRATQQSKPGDPEQDGKADIPYEKLLKKYDDLSKAYRNLKDKHAECRPYVDRATEKYRAAKTVVKQWQQFYDHMRKKADRLHEDSVGVNRPSSPLPEAFDLERTPRPISKRDGLKPRDYEIEKDGDANAEPRFTDEEAELPVQDELELDQRNSEDSSMALDSRAARVTSSQTTQEESDPPMPHNADPSSDDEPGFVSTRPFKRRRGDSPQTKKVSTQIKQERTSPSQPQEINSEDYSSPVLKRRKPLRRETSNLDAIAGNLNSPRRHRRQRASSAEVVQPPRISNMASSLSEGNAPDHSYPMVKEEPSSSEDMAGQAVRARDFALQAEGSNASQRALQPLSANVARPTPPRIDESRVKRKRKGDDEDYEATAAKAAAVTEDGDMNSSQVHVQGRKGVLNAAMSRRLDSLLDEPTPGRQRVTGRAAPEPPNQHLRQKPAPLEPRSTKAMNTSPIKKQLVERPPVFRMPNLNTSQQTAVPKTTSRQSRTEHSPPPLDPEDEPLRARPVVRLSIEDFKINPKYKGTDFAFADTLRGRDQRRCLPGCTKPECCGDAFRKMVDMGVKSKKTDEDCLEAYLGPAYKIHMASLTPAKRKDVLAEARAYAIASEHGKHRQAFKRRPSPPGFWRIDMPSTQEEEQDRIQAQGMVRQEVYDRWREAMVPGGRWKFRDE